MITTLLGIIMLLINLVVVITYPVVLVTDVNFERDYPNFHWGCFVAVFVILFIVMDQIISNDLAGKEDAEYWKAKYYDKNDLPISADELRKRTEQ